MATMSLETRRQVIRLHQCGWKLKHIHSHLQKEDIKVSKTSLCLLIRKYRRFGTVADLPRSPPPKKLMLVHLQVIDEALAQDDEISTPELCALLNEVKSKVEKGCPLALPNVQSRI